MPLFNNWPYIDLSNLNLNWIISKIKHIDTVEQTVEELSVNLPEYTAAAQSAATAANTAAENAQAATTAAEAVRDQAQAAAHDADLAAQEARVQADNARDKADEAQASADLATSKAADAGTAAIDASTYAQAASASAQAAAASDLSASNHDQSAYNYSQAAASSAQAADASAHRAETAASSEGFTGTGGKITPQTSATWNLLPGQYLFTYIVDNPNENQSGQFMISYDGSSYRYRMLAYAGSSIIISLIHNNNLLTIRNQSHEHNMNWFLLGYNTGS